MTSDSRLLPRQQASDLRECAQTSAPPIPFDHALSRSRRADLGLCVEFPAGEYVDGRGSPACCPNHSILKARSPSSPALALARRNRDGDSLPAGRARCSRRSDRIHERAAELEAVGIRSIGVTVDLTNEEQVRDVVASVSHDLGTPTVLVKNAGMTSVSLPALKVSSSGGAESGAAYAAAKAGMHALPETVSR